MGDRYILDLRCPYCNTLNKEIWFAPTSNSLSHICINCKKEFFISSCLVPVKKEDWTIDMEKLAFKMTTTVYSPDEVERMYKEKEVK